MIRRIATAKAGKGKPAIIIEYTNGDRAEFSHADLITYDTLSKIKDEVALQTGRSLADLVDLHFHINVDGSISVAYGEAPDIWPENDLENAK